MSKEDEGMTNITELKNVAEEAGKVFVSMKAVGHKPRSPEFEGALAAKNRAEDAYKKAFSVSDSTSRPKSPASTLKVGDRLTGVIDSLGNRGFGFVKGEGFRLFFLVFASRVAEEKLKKGVSVDFMVSKNKTGLTAQIEGLAEPVSVRVPVQSVENPTDVTKVELATKPRQPKKTKPAPKKQVQNKKSEPGAAQLVQSAPVSVEDIIPPKHAEEWGSHGKGRKPTKSDEKTVRAAPYKRSKAGARTKQDRNPAEIARKIALAAKKTRDENRTTFAQSAEAVTLLSSSKGGKVQCSVTSGGRTLTFHCLKKGEDIVTREGVVLPAI